jgi:hypothetical protein
MKRLIKIIYFVVFTGCAQPSVDVGFPDGGSLAPADTRDEWMRVFVSRGLYRGNLGGVSGADAKCQAEAAQAQLGGKWNAWISSGLPTPAFPPRWEEHVRPEVSHAIDHIADAGPWVDVPRESVLFQHHVTLTGYPRAPVRLDQFGVAVEDHAPIWTGTDFGGRSTDYSNCNAWHFDGPGQRRAASFGRAAETSAEWTRAIGLRECDQPAHVLCFEEPVEQFQ